MPSASATSSPISRRAEAAIIRTQRDVGAVGKILLALGALLAALLIGFLASQPPAPLSPDAPANQFSAGRAMADVTEMSRAPRPTGSAENARVRSYLTARIRGLGMIVATQTGPLPPEKAERLAEWGEPNAAAAQVVNVIGILPGSDRTKPALLLMAHHDSVWASPGAADDAAGVAAALEIVRALKIRGRIERDVILLFTDAEEIGLNGARLFFAPDPVARRIGAVINMEARGSGGRTAMFETGRGNGEWMELYRRNVARPSSNSLAVLIYEVMPNNTDFTIPKKLGIPGYNFAFIGRSGLYHSPMATAEALEQGAMQDMGAQALGVASALAFSPTLPARSADAVFGDVLGSFVIAYRPAMGWGLLALSAVLLAFAWVRLKKRALLTGREVLAGAAGATALLLHAMLFLRVANLLSGSGAGRNYYDRLAALPRLELQAFLLCLAALLIACIALRPTRRILAPVPALLLTLIGMVLGGGALPLVGMGVAAAASAMLLPRGGTTVWGGWLGFALLVFLLALLVQIAAPTAGPVLAWPLSLAAIAAALAALLDPELKRLSALVAIFLVAVLGAAQLFYLAHLTFLGIGAGTPEVMALYTLLVALLVWPLFRSAASPRPFAVGAAVLLVAATGVALSVRLDPMAETVPPYSLRKWERSAGTRAKKKKATRSISEPLLRPLIRPKAPLSGDSFSASRTGRNGGPWPCRTSYARPRADRG